MIPARGCVKVLVVGVVILPRSLDFQINISGASEKSSPHSRRYSVVVVIDSIVRNLMRIDIYIVCQVRMLSQHAESPPTKQARCGGEFRWGVEVM
jgi:hypothetical protein